jgi:hypothetical protein
MQLAQENPDDFKILEGVKALNVFSIKKFLSNCYKRRSS